MTPIGRLSLPVVCLLSIAYGFTSSPFLRLETRLENGFLALFRPSRRHPRRGVQVGSLATDAASKPSETTDPWEACWAATTWTVNPSASPEIDHILQHLRSPAPQSLFAIQHALRVEEDSVQQALQQCAFLLKSSSQFTLKRCDPKNATTIRTCRPGIDWSVVSTDTKHLMTGAGEEWDRVTPPTDFVTCIQMAKELLSCAQESSYFYDARDLVQKKQDAVVDLIHAQLDRTLGTDIRGRAGADAAFSLALAGVTDALVFTKLATVATLELSRVGARPSRRPQDILAVVEKLVAAGVHGPPLKHLLTVATACLATKQNDGGSQHILTMDQLNLFSERPMLWLWRFSSKLTKPSPHLELSESWYDTFDDPSWPLVMDVGCGLGMSLLRLASLETSRENGPINGVSWADCNYVGGDLSSLTIGYARGIAYRWGLRKACFVVASAESLLVEATQLYPGPIVLVLLQFPTPYRLEEDARGGNTQLPDSPDAFMASPVTLAQITPILQKSNGRLLIQSNCEDVALFMRDQAVANGLTCVSATISAVAVDAPRATRTDRWLQAGGRRAVGPEWSAQPLIPAQTETEVACQWQGTPVHRCLLQYAS